jgi:hypothetical protein
MSINGVSDFFITLSYFKLHLQNAYQLEGQLKKFYEQ